MQASPYQQTINRSFTLMGKGLHSAEPGALSHAHEPLGLCLPPRARKLHMRAVLFEYHEHRHLHEDRLLTSKTEHSCLCHRSATRRSLCTVYHSRSTSNVLQPLDIGRALHDL
jgi:hypothetical protein